LGDELLKLKLKLSEDLNRLRSQNRLEINLEKGKKFDDFSRLLVLLKETETKIGKESTDFKAKLNSLKLDTIRSILAASASLGVVVLGYMRLMK
jgi:hypothetical protein